MKRLEVFLQLRLESPPCIVAAILRSDDVRSHPDRLGLELYARKLAVIVITPQSGRAAVQERPGRKKA